MKNKCKNENEMKISLLTVLFNFGTKIMTLLSSLWGWVGTSILAILAYFFALKTMVIIIFVVVLIDMLLGIYIHRNEIQSSKLRESLLKFLIYIVLIGLTYSVEVEVGIAILYKIVFAIASLTEIYSIAAQLLVICPNLPFLSLFKNILAAEISKKTNMEQSKIDEILVEKDDLLK